MCIFNDSNAEMKFVANDLFVCFLMVVFEINMCGAYWIFSSAATSDAKIKDVPSSSDGPVSPDVFLPNLSDELQELVRNVFSLKKIKQKYFSETIIPRFVPLAKEPQLVNTVHWFEFPWFTSDENWSERWKPQLNILTGIANLQDKCPRTPLG